MAKQCWYCGNILIKRTKKHRHMGDKTRILTRDHLVPKALAEGLENNVVDACQQCNEEKGCLTLEEFRAVIAVREGTLQDVRQYWKFHGET